MPTPVGIPSVRDQVPVLTQQLADVVESEALPIVFDEEAARARVHSDGSKAVNRAEPAARRHARSHIANANDLQARITSAIQQGGEFLAAASAETKRAFKGRFAMREPMEVNEDRRRPMRQRGR